MAKFRVSVKVIATFTYETEVEAQDEAEAEREATTGTKLQANMPEDFEVDKGYCAYETETEQRTAICPGCDVEHAVLTCDTRLCSCAAIGEGKSTYPNGDPLHIPHLVVNDVCTPAPWWEEDPDYCRACGLKEAAEYAAIFKETHHA